MWGCFEMSTVERILSTFTIFKPLNGLLGARDIIVGHKRPLMMGRQDVLVSPWSFQIVGHLLLLS